MTETARPLVAGNWKMNGLRAEGLDLARALATKAGEGAAPGCDVLVCPPATALVEVAAVLEGSAILLGAQDCHAVPSGAHTGDLGAEMLADAGCRFVIVGHSERRANHRESDAEVRAKAEAAHRAGLVAIVCVGESEAQRRSGAHLEVVAGQLEGSLPEGADAADTVLAYEPVWAIGTGLTANVAEVAEMHAHLRARLGAARADLRILYGGSVTPDNAGELLAVENVNGALVGGASLKADAFWGIVQSCA